jgi:hypothetical protein
MAQTFLGSAQTFTGIPSLLISDLGRVQDPVVRRALLQVQNYCNSVGEVHGSTGGATATLGTQFPGTVTTPKTWTRVSFQGTVAYIPVWI